MPKLLYELGSSSNSSPTKDRSIDFLPASLLSAAHRSSLKRAGYYRKIVIIGKFFVALQKSLPSGPPGLLTSKIFSVFFFFFSTPTAAAIINFSGQSFFTPERIPVNVQSFSVGDFPTSQPPPIRVKNFLYRSDAQPQCF